MRKAAGITEGRHERKEKRQEHEREGRNCRKEKKGKEEEAGS